MVEPLPGEHFHQMPDDVRGYAVAPAAAGLEAQGQGPESLHKLGIGEPGAVQFVGPIECIHRVFLHKAVGEPCRVGEEVPVGDAPLRRDRLRILRVAANENGHILEGGKHAIDGIVELKEPAFVQHHKRDAHDGLGHGVNSEEGIGFHRLALFHIPLPVAAVVGDPAPTGNEHLPPRQAPIIHVGFQVVI